MILCLIKVHLNGKTAPSITWLARLFMMLISKKVLKENRITIAASLSSLVTMPISHVTLSLEMIWRKHFLLPMKHRKNSESAAFFKTLLSELPRRILQKIWLTTVRIVTLALGTITLLSVLMDLVHFSIVFGKNRSKLLMEVIIINLHFSISWVLLRVTPNLSKFSNLLKILGQNLKTLKKLFLFQKNVKALNYAPTGDMSHNLLLQWIQRARRKKIFDYD